MSNTRQANHSDLEAIQNILETGGLSAHGILESNTAYWLAESDENPIGCVGLEWGERVALLRSAAVLPEHRKHGIGTKLLEVALHGARANQKKTVYLFSTDAGAYWMRQGFKEVPVPELVAALPDTPQVHHYQDLGWLPTEIAWRLEL